MVGNLKQLELSDCPMALICVSWKAEKRDVLRWLETRTVVGGLVGLVLELLRICRQTQALLIIKIICPTFKMPVYISSR
jgi:hypothetical protein